MKSGLNIRPRQSGKTTDMMDSFINKMKTTDLNCLILLHNQDYINKLSKDFGIDKDYFTTPNKLPVEYFNKNVDIIYVDEYFLLPLETKKFIFNLAIMGKVVFAYGSPVVQFNKEDVLAVREWWKLTVSRNILNKILCSEQQLSERFGEELVYNLLVIPDINISDKYNDIKPTMSKERFESEFLGNIYKN